ncbi:MAG: hypothetical protein K0R21_704 [Anaerocolumna sp.]|jgi:tetratricopeptide (TPR) repeat protein|nr:hypothetical protein [Anaerocolumna sp.]
MICPGCGNIVAIKRTRCEKCGEDLLTYKKVIISSNMYYNEGLEKTKVRDLSGAILVLKKSLEMNKRNTQARNLLGLVYYEIGETVSALSEWVISKHFQPEDNDADDYMNALQSNPTKLEALNQTIKKYNSALQSAKQGNEDLAIIQLKKVTSLNPHFVKALQLLALLHMKNNERDKALKCLNKASKIDVSNTTTLRYLHELDELAGAAGELVKSGKKEIAKVSKEPSVFPISTYKEDKPNIWNFLNLIIGIAIGVGVLFFLIVPTVREDVINDYKNTEIEYGEQLSKQTQTISSLENENQNLQAQITQLKSDLDGFQGEAANGNAYDELFTAASVYLTELAKDNARDIDYVKVADALGKVNYDTLEKQGSKDLYNAIKEGVFVQASEILYDDGHDLYTGGDYENALTSLEKAYQYDPDNVNAIYFIGRSYHQQGDYDKAKEYYTILTENFSDSSRAKEAKDRLAELE